MSNRGGRGGGVNGGHAGGSQKGGGAPILHGRHDRFCSYCGAVVEMQNIRKTAGCPHPHCQREIMFRKGFSMNSGWGRCPSCDCFIHVTNYYCVMCGVKHEEAFKRREEAEKKKISKQLAEKEAENLNLRQELEKMRSEKRAKEREGQSEGEGVKKPRTDDEGGDSAFFGDFTSDDEEKGKGGNETDTQEDK